MNLVADADYQFKKEETVMGIVGYSATIRISLQINRWVSGVLFKTTVIYLFICV